jgi:uncharacterized integral membrane protein (TIGR00698 family)
MNAQPVCAVPAGPIRSFLSPSGSTVLLAIAGALCLTPYASPALALAFGIVLAFLGNQPLPVIARRATRPLLQASIVLLGFGMNLRAMVSAARDGFFLALGTILLTFLLGALLRRVLKVAHPVAILVSAGTAICGGSAIAATALSIGAAEADISVAVGTIFLLNAAALYLFPMFGHAFGLTQSQFGTWSGIAIHDVSSVVGAAATYGQLSLQTATAVKLSRTLWIIPVSLIAGLAVRRSEPAAPRMTIPWFIGAFLLACLATTFLPALATFTPTLLQIARAGMTLTLLLIGTRLSRSTLQQTGLRPMLLGLVLWLTVSAGSLLLIRGVGH